MSSTYHKSLQTPKSVSRQSVESNSKSSSKVNFAILDKLTGDFDSPKSNSMHDKLASDSCIADPRLIKPSNVHYDFNGTESGGKLYFSSPPTQSAISLGACESVASGSFDSSFGRVNTLTPR